MGIPMDPMGPMGPKGIPMGTVGPMDPMDPMVPMGRMGPPKTISKSIKLLWDLFSPYAHSWASEFLRHA